jgi:hypothetical protein
MPIVEIESRKSRTTMKKLGWLLMSGLLSLSLLLAPASVRPAQAATNAWSITPSTNLSNYENYLNAVSASSPTDAWAVGNYLIDPTNRRPFIQRWGGTAWNSYSAPFYSVLEHDLLGVKVISSDNAWAVGYYEDNNVKKTFILHWNGASWGIVSSPNSNEIYDHELTAVAAVSADEVWAVGTYFNGSTLRTLTMRWLSSTERWDIISSPSPAQPNSVADHLTGVAASADGDVKAIGYFYNGNSSRYETLVLQWNRTGGYWTAPSIPNVGSSHNYLKGITIATGYYDAHAVGYYMDGGQK